mmetsp:Transcript_37439/g.90025  ORF Transcript_37439/g.90025 Transcript_37439/m.90025 type:complete len:123 (-) Transcript_37439:8-376(-)
MTERQLQDLKILENHIRQNFQLMASTELKYRRFLFLLLGADVLAVYHLLTSEGWWGEDAAAVAVACGPILAAGSLTCCVLASVMYSDRIMGSQKYAEQMNKSLINYHMHFDAKSQRLRIHDI